MFNMKKQLSALLVAGCFFAMAATSCGEKFTPLTEDEINTKVEEGYNAIAETKRAELKAACEADKAAKVAAKVAEFQSGAAN